MLCCLGQHTLLSRQHCPCLRGDMASPPAFTKPEPSLLTCPRSPFWSMSHMSPCLFFFFNHNLLVGRTTCLHYPLSLGLAADQALRMYNGMFAGMLKMRFPPWGWILRPCGFAQCFRQQNLFHGGCPVQSALHGSIKNRCE